MRLHEDKELFRDAVTAASRPKEEGGLGIRPILLNRISREIPSVSDVEESITQILSCIKV